MRQTHEWPLPCKSALIKWLETHPAPNGLELQKIGDEIATMPEAKAHGLVPSVKAVRGKIFRWRLQQNKHVPKSDSRFKKKDGSLSV
jgi:hypothetical protein